MNKKRVKREARALNDLCGIVKCDLDQGFVALEQFPFPDQWNRRTSAIVYDLPDNYPMEQPDAFIPEEMRYQESRPMVMLRSGPPGWSKYCIHSLRKDWNPGCHSLVTITRMLVKSLEHPNKHDPWGDDE